MIVRYSPGTVHVLHSQKVNLVSPVKERHGCEYSPGVYLSSCNVLLHRNPLIYKTEVGCSTDPRGRCPISQTDTSCLRFPLHAV